MRVLKVQFEHAHTIFKFCYIVWFYLCAEVATVFCQPRACTELHYCLVRFNLK